MFAYLRKILQFRENGGSLLYFIQRRLSNSLPRQLLNATPERYWNHSARRINAIRGCEDFDYLEIGVSYGTTLQAVKARTKTAVDPLPLFDCTRLPSNTIVFQKESDVFFQELPAGKKFDFIFLDGLHEASQLTRDVINALKHLRSDGWILIDDIVPSDSISAIPDIELSYSARGVNRSEGFPWHGNCFKILPWIYEMKFLLPFLIIYPDNPQLLLKVVDWNACNEFLETTPLNEVKIHELEFSDVFDSKSLREMPLYIEEILIKEIQFELGRQT